jgi:hypothetical protein
MTAGRIGNPSYGELVLFMFTLCRSRVEQDGLANIRDGTSENYPSNDATNTRNQPPVNT